MDNLPLYYKTSDKNFKLFITPAEIKQTVENLAEAIRKDYSGKKPLFLVVLKGSIFFASDLLRVLNIDCEIETVRTKSYGSSMSSDGNVEILTGSLDLAGRDVIIIEDIVDTGFTLSKLMEKLEMLNPRSLETVSFLSKPVQRKVNMKIKYVGIEIPPLFVIGYGLDFAEGGRHLPAIYILDEQ